MVQWCSGSIVVVQWYSEYSDSIVVVSSSGSCGVNSSVVIE